MATIPRPVRNGLSTNNSRQGGMPTGNTITLSDMAAGGQLPATVIEQNSVASGNTLRYPADIPPYFMIIGINEYSRASWLELGALKLGTTIALPLPQQLQDASRVEYEEVKLGTIAGQAVNAGSAAMDLLRNGVAPGKSGVLGEAFGTVGALATEAAGSLGQAAQIGMGYSVNQFQTVMLKGPTYKEHSFTWHFSPDSEAESRTLSQIKWALDDAKAPSLAPYVGSAFWLWPRVLTMTFMHADGTDMGARLFRFKPMVICDIAFDFTAAGQPAFYRGSKAAQSMSLTLKVRELEYWLRGDPLMQGF